MLSFASLASVLAIKFPPNMTEEQRKKLENEAKSWLQIQINEIAFKRKCAVRNEKK